MNAYFICNYNCRQRRSRLNAACGISSGSTWFAKTKMIFRERTAICLEIKTCDPLNYTMDHSKFISSIQKEEFISSFKSSANYYIYSTGKSELHVYDKTSNLVIFVLLSLTELYLQQIMHVSC